jgi:hypothetical protein
VRKKSDSYLSLSKERLVKGTKFQWQNIRYFKIKKNSSLICGCSGIGLGSKWLHEPLNVIYIVLALCAVFQ